MSAPPETAVIPCVLRLIVRNRFQTTPNAFGLWKDYLYRPSQDPDAVIMAEDLYRPGPDTSMDSTIDLGLHETEVPSPYKNKSIELVIDWQNSSSSAKSNGEINRLVCDVLRHPDFRLEELEHFNAARKNRKVDVADSEENPSFLLSFTHTNISINVPSGSKLTTPRSFSIPGLYYRKIMSLIQESFQSPIFRHFHLSPFNLYRKHPDGEADERIYSELYDSDIFYNEHDKVQRAPSDDETCKREKVVAALMFWSDATQLATFGTAKIWPVYMLFGNLSKYIRLKANSGATKHLAYIPPLPDSLQDELKTFHSKWGTQQKAILTHCRRELMHAVWRVLLDDDFIHAHTYGIVVRCHDGVERRIYPRIFTYSADYPEK
jgi:hypothetical protein